MKLVVLAENTACRRDVVPQHGLSLYLETGGCKILFDMGQDDTFAHNAEVLGVDLTQVDLAVLSHGHYDHGGGLGAFLERNATAPVYVHKEAFGAFYNGREKYIGLDTALRTDPRLVLTEGSVALTPKITLTDGNQPAWTVNSWGLNQKEGCCFQPDGFRHEQYLQITEGSRSILISGCSHRGIENIADFFAPHILIGGFHLKKQAGRDALCRTGMHLLSGRTQYYTGHCTGSLQYEVLKQVMGSRLEAFSTGSVLQI